VFRSFHALFVILFNLFVLNVEVDVVGPLLLNASLLLIANDSTGVHLLSS